MTVNVGYWILYMSIRTGIRIVGEQRCLALQVLEQALKDVDFWKEELEHAVEEKNQWRDKSIAAQKQLREMEQLKKQIVALREEKYHTGKQYDRALQEVQRLRARKAEQLNQVRCLPGSTAMACALCCQPL
jgi:hypothetical protein